MTEIKDVLVLCERVSIVRTCKALSGKRVRNHPDLSPASESSGFPGLPLPQFRGEAHRGGAFVGQRRASGRLCSAGLPAAWHRELIGGMVAVLPPMLRDATLSPPQTQAPWAPSQRYEGGIGQPP